MAEKCAVCESETCLIHCAYCNVDVGVGSHAADCPSTTGVFPIRPVDMGQECPHCGKRPGMACAICSTPFSIGDFYTEVPDPSSDDVALVVCIGCGLLRRDEAWSA